MSTGSLVSSFWLSLSFAPCVFALVGGLSSRTLPFSAGSAGGRAACESAVGSGRSGGGTSPAVSFRGVGAALPAGPASMPALAVPIGTGPIFAGPVAAKLNGTAAGEGRSAVGGGTVPASRDANKAAPGVEPVRAGESGGMAPAGGSSAVIKSGGNQGLLVILSDCSRKSNARIIGREGRKLEGVSDLKRAACGVIS